MMQWVFEFDLFMPVIKRLQKTHSSLGLYNGLWYLLGQALHRISPSCAVYKYHLVVQPIAQRARLSGHQGASIEVRPILENDPSIGTMERPAAVITRRFNGGAVCLGAFKADELVGYIWLQLGPYMEDEVRCRFIPQPENLAVWDFDIFVHPKQRFGFAFAKLWDAADAMMRARGIRWTMSRISAFNTASLMAHQKLGSKCVGSSLYIVLGNTQVTVSNLFPFIHLSLSTNRFPTLRVNAPHTN